MDERKKNLLVNAATNKVRVSLYLFSIVFGRVIRVNPFLGNRKAVSIGRTVTSEAAFRHRILETSGVS